MVNRGVALLAAAALFASGLAVGALGAHLFYAQKISVRMGPPMPVGPMFERWIERELELSPQQRTQVGEILERSHREAEAIRRDVGPRIIEINRSTAEAISAVLTPEQREKLEMWMARRDRMQRRFGDREPPRHRRRGRRPPTRGGGGL